VSIDQTIVNSGAQININSGITLTIANGTGTDLIVNGTIGNSGTITPTGTISFASGGIYQHSQNGGAIPTATWNLNSTCLITGTTTTIPTNTGQSFGNFTWDCTNQTVASTPASVFNIQGNLTVQSTGTIAITGQFRMGNGTNNVLGNYSQTGGTVRISSNTARSLIVGGNLSLTAGTLLMSSGSTIGTLNVAGNFSHTAGTIDETSTGSGTILFNGSTNQNITGGGTISNTINFTINNSAGITLRTSVIFPATLTMTNGNISLNGNTLTLGTGTTAATRGTLIWTSGFITGSGTFTRWFSNAAITLGNVLGMFPMGNSTDNRNVWIGGTPSTGGTVSVQHNNLTGTTALSFTENSQNFDKRTNMSWTLSAANGFAGLAFALRIQGGGIPGINAVGDLNICLASGIAGGTYSAPGGTIANPQVNRSGLTQTTLANTFYFASTSGSPLPVELSSFSAVVLENGVKLKWRTETEVNNFGFEIERADINLKSEIRNPQFSKLGFVQGNGNSNSPKNYSFNDENVSAGKYSYRLKQIDTDGNFEYSKTIEVDLGLPRKFELSQNFPNPFNPTTTISFTLPESGNINLTVYNIIGEQVEQLFNGYKEAGIHTINFNASELNSGIYIYKIEANGLTKSRKMMLVK
jgi:hypothetical protein